MTNQMHADLKVWSLSHQALTFVHDLTNETNESVI